MVCSAVDPVFCCSGSVDRFDRRFETKQPRQQFVISLQAMVHVAPWHMQLSRVLPHLGSLQMESRNDRCHTRIFSSLACSSLVQPFFLTGKPV